MSKAADGTCRHARSHERIGVTANLTPYTENKSTGENIIKERWNFYHQYIKD